MQYSEMSKEELLTLQAELNQQYAEAKAKGLNLDMSRGKPSATQLNVSLGLLDAINASSDLKAENGTDCRNYGVLDGIPEAKKLMADMMGTTPEHIIVYGNASLNIMYDQVSRAYTHGILGNTPWGRLDKVKFLCPVPGYDRHFGITQYYGFELIPIPMDDNGPDMDMVERLVSEDDSIKGIWCVPKYSNPAGTTYSDEVVKRFAALKPAAKDFRIMWDNAYCIHEISDTPDVLLNIMDECKKTGNEDLPILFCSTSKITFPGAGVAAMAASENNLKVLREKYNYEIISYDKLNMLRHVRFFKNYDGVLKHMEKHKSVLKPKFEIVLDTLDKELAPADIASWKKPHGGYFVSVDVFEGTAKRTVALCKEAGVVLTGAGATYPLGIDPKDSNIRIAPTFPPNHELEVAMDVFCICARLAACEKILNK